MLATALALSAADKAEADRLDKQQAAAEAAKKAQEVRDQYEIAKAQANADATHRAFRSVIATGHAAGTPNAEALPTTVPLPVTADGTAITAQQPAASPLAVAPDHLQALRAAADTPLALGDSPPALAPVADPVTTAPNSATAPSQAAAAASIFDRFGHAIACYSHINQRRS